jgi:glycolate oxidase FAD binding subunit
MTMMTPQTEAELAAMGADAQGPLCIKGGGTQGCAVEGQILSASGLAGVELYDPGALTLVVRAGTPMQEIETLLASENQQLAFEPMDHRALLGTNGEPTVGGVVAANISGPRRIQAGAARDHLLGVRFVDGAGTVIKNGGRVMKNVTGYDLVKLMAGSHGTLGVLSEVSLKVLPRPEMRGVLLYYGLTDRDAFAAMSRALGSPFEVSGAVHMPSGMDGHPVTMLRIEGFEESVTYRLGQLRALLKSFGDPLVEVDQTKTAAGWAWVRDVALFHGRPGNVWRISVKPSDALDLVAKIAPTSVMYDWGGGRIWCLADPSIDVRTAMAGIGGHATLVRGKGFARFHPDPAPVARLSAALRAQFDPRGILNTGLMG